MILVDYKCTSCGVMRERLVAQPVPNTDTCPDCGSGTRRTYASAGLVGTASPGRSTHCVDNPFIPGLCHVGPSARRALIARATGDDKAYAEERQHQTAEYEKTGPPSLGSVIAPGHVHHSTPRAAGAV